MRLLSCILFISLIVACAPTIVQKPIPFPEERIAMSLDYMREHHELIQDDPFITPRIVVVHWTAIDNFESSWRAFESSLLPSSRTGIASGGNLNVSAQFLIDRDGTIYQLMPDTLFARHTIGLNYTAIGIENVGGRNMPLNRKQFRANKFLIEQLMKEHPIQYVIGHHEYQQFRGHTLWKESDPDYLTSKVDPGDEFMQKLRKKLGDVDGPPSK